MNNIIKKIKKGLKKILEKIDYENHKGIIVGILMFVGLFLLIGIIYLISSKSMSDLERRELEKTNEDLKYYLEYFDNEDNNDDKYVLFAMNYSKNNDGTNSLSSNDMASLINSKVNKNFNEDNIKNIGISEKLANEGITYNPGVNVYEIKSVETNPTDIKEKQISYYKLTKLSKVNMKKFSMVYQKYTIEDPFKVLNYYIDYNANNTDYVDIVPYRNYVSGSANVIDFKRSIRDDDISNFARKDYKIKVTYVVNNNKILIDKVGRCTIC